MTRPIHGIKVRDEFKVIHPQTGNGNGTTANAQIPKVSVRLSVPTIIASFIVLLFTFVGFTEPASNFGSPFHYAGWAFMGWFGLLSFAYGLASVTFATLRRHFSLALLGAVFPLLSCVVEWINITNAPVYGLGTYGTFFEVIYVQIFFSLAGIAAIIISKNQFS